MAIINMVLSPGAFNNCEDFAVTLYSLSLKRIKVATTKTAMAT
jgi:hypothetical protein